MVVAAGAGLLAVCGKQAEVRTRITVEVDTPQGIRRGSSVWSSAISKVNLPLPANYSGHFRGEAVAVDLPNGKTLFALVKDQEMIADRQFSHLRNKPETDRLDAIATIATHVGATRQLSCTPVPEGLTVAQRSDLKYDCPLLVTFRDMRDPRSVERVDPGALDKSFGAGVKLRWITVAVTDDPVTTGIEKRLGWLPKVYATMLDGSPINNSQALSNSLTQSDFVSGRKL